MHLYCYLRIFLPKLLNQLYIVYIRCSAAASFHFSKPFLTIENYIKSCLGARCAFIVVYVVRTRASGKVNTRIWVLACGTLVKCDNKIVDKKLKHIFAPTNTTSSLTTSVVINLHFLKMSFLVMSNCVFISSHGRWSKYNMDF